jgi:hypothetical protein
VSYIPYSEFKERVKGIVFPDGEAENLQDTHDAYIKDALINLQTFVPCLKENHVDFYDKEDFQEWCNADFTYIERGVVHAVYAFKISKRCRKLYYDQKSMQFIDNWMQRQSCVTCSDADDETDVTRSPACNTMSDADTYCEDNADESDCLFKGSRRFYGIGPNHKLFLAPRFPCGYRIAVHWEGLKRSWEEADPVPDEMDLIIAVAKYVQAQRALFLDRDMPLYDRIMHPRNGEFTIARADMIHRCNKERRIQNRVAAVDGFDVLQGVLFDALPEDEDVFAYFADWGLIGDDSAAVEELVESWSPEFIVTGGDNKYGATMADVLATLPYYQSMIDAELFYPAIGNHDLSDGGGLADFLATFSYIDYFQQRNYSIRKRHVEIFFMETHDTGTAPPNLQFQEAWLAAALARSTAPFKIVITQDPPFTSEGGSNYPGHEDSQLDYEGMGADLVLSGDSHFYERFNVDGFPYITAGTGGATVSGFDDVPVEGSVVRYNTHKGAVHITASARRLKVEFVNVIGQLIDTITLTK